MGLASLPVRGKFWERGGAPPSNQALPWTVTCSSLCRVRWVIVARLAVGPVHVALVVCAWGPVLGQLWRWLVLQESSCIVFPTGP